MKLRTAPCSYSPESPDIISDVQQVGSRFDGGSRSSRSSPGGTEPALLLLSKPCCCASTRSSPGGPSGLRSAMGHPATPATVQHGSQFGVKRGRSLGMGGWGGQGGSSPPLMPAQCLPQHMVSSLTSSLLNTHTSTGPPLAATAATAAVLQPATDLREPAADMASLWQPQPQPLPYAGSLSQPSSTSHSGPHTPTLSGTRVHHRHLLQHHTASPLSSPPSSSTVTTSPPAGIITSPADVSLVARNPELFLRISDCLAEMGWRVQQAKEAEAMAVTSPPPSTLAAPKLASRGSCLRCWRTTRFRTDRSWGVTTRSPQHWPKVQAQVEGCT